LKNLIGYPKMLVEAKQSKRKGHIWIVEILIFLLVFLIASTAESSLNSIASVFTVMPALFENLDSLMYVLQSEGFIAYIEAVIELMQTVTGASWYSLISLFITAAATVVAILYCVIIEKRSVASMGLRKKNFFLEYLGGAAVGIITISLAAVIGILSGAYSFSIGQPKAWWILLFLLGFIVQGMSEEVLCRGYLLVSMSRKTPVIVCAILTSLMFALLHVFNPGFGFLPFINLFLSGLSFAFYFIKRGNIWGACAMHTFWNFYQGPIFGISVSGTGCTEHAVFNTVAASAENMELWTGGAFGIEGGLCVTIVEVLTLLFVLFLLPKSKSEQFVPVVEPAAEPVAEPVTEPVAEPVTEPVTEPVAEPAPEPEQPVTPSDPIA